MSCTPRLISINTARVGRLLVPAGIGLPPRSEATAILKSPVSTLEDPTWIRVGRMGLEGDEQADLSVHGGPTKAVYLFPVEHFEGWQDFIGQETGRPTDPLRPGFFGENLTTEGLHEASLFIGDLLRIGEVELRITEPRFPCFKFEARCGVRRASRRMFQTGQCGSYLSVETPGVLQAGQEIELIPGAQETSIQKALQLRDRGQS